MICIGDKNDLLSNITKDLNQGDSVFNYLTKTLSFFIGNEFIDMNQGLQIHNGNLDDFDKMHRSGVYNVANSTLNRPLQKTGFAFFLKRNILETDEQEEIIKTNYNELQLFVTVDCEILLRVVVGLSNGQLNKGIWKEIYNQIPTLISSLDSYYYSIKMEERKILSEYIKYRDELNNYCKNKSKFQKPKIPDTIQNFAKEFNLI